MFYDYQNSEEYAQKADIGEVESSRGEFYEAIEGLDLDQETFFQIECAYGSSVADYELQGFIFGFQYAVEIMTACGFTLKEGEVA